jgi:hypothetical protein
MIEFETFETLGPNLILFHSALIKQHSGDLFLSIADAER